MFDNLHYFCGADLFAPLRELTKKKLVHLFIELCFRNLTLPRRSNNACCGKQVYNIQTHFCCYGFRHRDAPHLNCCGVTGAVVDSRYQRCVDGRIEPLTLKDDRRVDFEPSNVTDCTQNPRNVEQ